MDDLRIDELIHDGDFYDKVNTFSRDLHFYLELCNEAKGKVLELCAGTGRLTIPIFKSGVDITGLDYTDSMIKKAKEKAQNENLDINFLKGDIRDFNLNEKYDLIFIPFNSLQCVYTLKDVEKTFTCIKNHLTPKGKFVFEVFNPSINLMVSRAEKFHIRDIVLEDGRKVEISETCAYDSANQVNRTKWYHNIDGKEIIQNLDMRCFYPLEMDALLKYNKLEVLNKYGDFQKAPFTSESMKQIYVCKVLNG